MGSARFALDSIDWKKIWKGFLIAMAGPLALWLADTAGYVDVQIGVPVIAGLIGVVVNIIRKWVADNTVG